MIRQMDSVLKSSKLPFEMYGLYEDIFSSMEDLLRVIDKDGLVIYQNKPMLDQVGSLLGKKCHHLFGSETKCGTCICHNLFKGSKPILKEVKINGKTYSVISALLKDSPGYYVEVFRDISESKKHKKKIEEQNEKMKSDLEFAKLIQKSLIPENGRYSNMISFYGAYKPAEMLGGDMFDIIEMDDEGIAFYIADVSGHGVTSSLVTMFISQTLKNMKSILKNPCTVLDVLMEKYKELGIEDKKYFTIFYCYYDKKNKILKISNAGHNCPAVHIRKTQQKLDEIQAPGLPICEVYEYLTCNVDEIKVESGDRLILYTDGISEARDQEGEFFSSKIKSVFDSSKDFEIKGIVEGLLEEALSHSSGIVDDDMAIMGIEFI